MKPNSYRLFSDSDDAVVARNQEFPQDGYEIIFKMFDKGQDGNLSSIEFSKFIRYAYIYLGYITKP